MHVFYTLKVAFQYKDVVMAATEQAAVRKIWDKCARRPSRKASRACAGGLSHGWSTFDPFDSLRDEHRV